MAAALNNLTFLDMKGVDVTNNVTYRHVVTLMEGLRSKLLAAPSWRRPYIDVLASPYKFGDPGTKTKMKQLKPRRPTHADVLDYLQNHWPVVRFKNLRMNDEKIWGQTPVTLGGSDIGIHYTVVNRMVSLTKRASTRFIAPYYAADFMNSFSKQGWGGVLITTPRSTSSF